MEDNIFGISAGGFSAANPITTGRSHFVIRRMPWLILLLGLSGMAAAYSQERPSDPPNATDSAQVSKTPANVPDEPMPAVRVRLGGGDVGVDPGSAGIHLEGAGSRPLGDPDPTTAEAFKRVEFVGAPIPIVNPTVGNGLGGLGGVVVHLDPNDKKSPPSVFGGGAGFTSNGTRIFGAGAELFVKEDRFRILSVFSGGKVNYEFYGIGHNNGDAGQFIPIRLDARLFLIEPKARIVNRWYVGPRYHLMKSDVALDREKLQAKLSGSTLMQDLPTIPERDLTVRAGALGFRLQRDTRDQQFYPLRGSVLDWKVDFADPAFASQRTYQQVNVSFQAYQAFRKKNVLAYRFALCSASGDVPFYGLCMLGSSKDIRGYAVGRYQDRRMVVSQLELRRKLFSKVGAVAFLGAGEVVPEFSRLNTNSILPGGGVGLRLTLSEQNNINLRVDYAWGVGSTAFYIGIGESF